MVKISREKISCMESSKSCHSHVLDVHISVNSFRVNVLFYLGQNWSFIFWCQDLQRRNNSLSIQVNFDNKTVEMKIIFLDCRIPLSNESRFGFSSNLVLLMWCVWGGFLLHILECNYLTVLVKPVYEKPIDTAEDIIERGLRTIYGPGRKSMLETLKSSPYPLTRTLAENTYLTKVG